MDRLLEDPSENWIKLAHGKGSGFVGMQAEAADKKGDSLLVLDRGLRDGHEIQINPIPASKYGLQNDSRSSNAGTLKSSLKKYSNKNQSRMYR